MQGRGAVKPLLEPSRLRALSDEIRLLADRLANPRSAPDHPVTAADVRAIIRARRMRRDYLDSDLFADPAWDMLLDLTAARLEGRPVSVSSLCLASGVAPTTALRWIGMLEGRGLITREPAPDDRRKVFISLTDAATEAMERYLTAAAAVSGLVN